MDSSRDMNAAEMFAHWTAQLRLAAIPADVIATLQRALVDAAGLMVAARGFDYMQAVVRACEQGGPCSVPGHAGAFAAGDAALIMGTGIHGEDFDDTFEGTPVHIGAVMVPALFAAGEAHGLSGADIARGLAAGGELMCRMAVAAPGAIHRQGFHPTAVIGALGAAAGVSAALRLEPAQIASALGIAGSMASGIIEYLAEGTSTKRLHPGWAAQSGIKAALLAREGFTGPRSVLDGTHGFFHAFTDRSVTPDLASITAGLGEDWRIANLAFKPFACGTMIQPYIDCALSLRGEIANISDVAQITAPVGEGTVHRLWEPVSEKASPSTPYSAKFSGPYGIAIALIDGAAGLEQYTSARIAGAQVRALAAKVRHEIDPDNDYPRNYSGALHVTLKDGRSLDARQPHLRGGRHAPLSDSEIEAKFRANAAFGGWDGAVCDMYLSFCATVFDQSDLSGLARFRQ